MNDILYTVPEVSQLMKTNKAFVYSLIKQGLLPALKIRSLKVRKSSLMDFLEKFDGMDLSNLDDIHKLNVDMIKSE